MELDLSPIYEMQKMVIIGVIPLIVVGLIFIFSGIILFRKKREELKVKKELNEENLKGELKAL